MNRPQPAAHGPDALERFARAVRALRKYRGRVARKLEGLRGDLAEAERGPQYRRFGDTLLVYLKQVPARAASVALPDPHEPAVTHEIPLEPRLNAQSNAARYFKRAAKAGRGLKAVPPRLAAVEAELHALEVLLEKARPPLELAGEGEVPVLDHALVRAVEAALAALPPTVRVSLGALEPLRARAAGHGGGAADASSATGARARRRAAPPRPADVASGEERAPSAKLQPRRLKTAEGWDVLIGRTSEGNDYLTHHLARPEDYWFHVSGTSGSHVVLRRGKGKNEPSKQTIEEVAAWAAFYSQARTAGKVPVIVTRRKYVRKPRKGKAGLAHVEREKTVMVRPREPGNTTGP
jgi:predicted ribosome quality control (RQC) complex YloA/Tae2 family protein